MSLTDKNPTKTWTEEIKPYCCHLNLRDARKLPTLRIFLHWPVKMPIISPFEIHSFQPAEAVSQQAHGRGNTWTHAQTWESLMCLNAGQRKTSLPPCEDFQLSKLFS